MWYSHDLTQLITYADAIIDARHNLIELVGHVASFFHYRYMHPSRISFYFHSRLDGHSQLPKVILGAKFSDGIEVVRSQAQAAAA
jgi:hypothetical protein